jgi:Flp pilus assembly protein TadD
MEPAAPTAQQPTPPPDPLTLAHEHVPGTDHLAQARSLREEADLAGALLELRYALHDAPEDEEALSALARLAPHTGAPRLAALALGRLGALQPEDPLPLLQQARVLLAQKDYPAAIAAAEEALTRDPENAETYQVLGRGHLAAGELMRAIKRLQQAVALSPEHGYALNNLGFAYLQANENGRAVEVLERAAALLPEVAYVHNNLGVALEREGREDEARGAYLSALALSPRYVKAQLNFARLGQLASAAGSLPPEERTLREPLLDATHE